MIQRIINPDAFKDQDQPVNHILSSILFIFSETEKKKIPTRQLKRITPLCLYVFISINLHFSPVFTADRRSFGPRAVHTTGGRHCPRGRAIVCRLFASHIVLFRRPSAKDMVGYWFLSLIFFTFFVDWILLSATDWWLVAFLFSGTISHFFLFARSSKRSQINFFINLKSTWRAETSSRENAFQKIEANVRLKEGSGIARGKSWRGRKTLVSAMRVMYPICRSPSLPDLAGLGGLRLLFCPIFI